MIARTPKVVSDLYQWLPSYGETKVELVAKGVQLEVVVFYDSDTGDDKSRKIVFHGVASFFVSAVPGVELTKCNYEGVDASGALIEFEYSEAAQMWQNCLPWRDKMLRHYQVFFLAENKRIEVIAEECHIEE